jgi:hypothetical protein
MKQTDETELACFITTSFFAECGSGINGNVPLIYILKEKLTTFVVSPKKVISGQVNP